MQRKNIMILMISLSLVLLLGSSYALLRSAKVGSTPYVINVGTLQVTFEEGKTEKLSLENMYPMSDKEGSSQSKELGFVVKNTGNMEARYNVYLEETSTNPEFKNYIRFISNKNDQGYNEPKTMGYDKYIDLEARLGIEMSASYKVKVWLDYDAGNEYMNKTFTAKVVIESRQIDEENTLYTKINNAIKEHPNTTIVEDNVTYLSGTNDEVNYNYVWYSGKLWRIVAINSDETIKMITEDNMTAINWGNELDYSTSWIREWLNNDFKSTLYNYENLIDTNYKWNASSTTNATVPLSNTSIVVDAVGLLNIYETYQVLKNKNYNNFFLNNQSHWYTLNNNNQYIWFLNMGSGVIDANSTISYDKGAISVRPVVVLKNNINIASGNGTSDDPYKLLGDNQEVIYNQKLNTRIIGEYVKFSGNIYRIVNFNNNITKLIKIDYIKDSDNQIISKEFSSGSYKYGDIESQNSNYVEYYLNHDWYNSIPQDYRKMLVKSTYYLGFNYDHMSYKSTICENINDTMSIKECVKTNDVWNGYVGLPRVGEIFAVRNKNNNNNDNFWSLTPFSETKMRIIRSVGRISDDRGNESIFLNLKNAIRPTITLNKKVIITNGEGTVDTPFEISCPSCNNT